MTKKEETMLEAALIDKLAQDSASVESYENVLWQLGNNLIEDLIDSDLDRKTVFSKIEMERVKRKDASKIRLSIHLALCKQYQDIQQLKDKVTVREKELAIEFEAKKKGTDALNKHDEYEDEPDDDQLANSSENPDVFTTITGRQQPSEEKRVLFDFEVSKRSRINESKHYPAPLSTSALLNYPSFEEEERFRSKLIDILAKYSPLEPFGFERLNLSFVLLRVV